jgi:hypothetical protein
MREMTAAASLGEEPPHVPWTSSGAERRSPDAARLVRSERVVSAADKATTPQSLRNARRFMQKDHNVFVTRKYGQIGLSVAYKSPSLHLPRNS